MAPQSYKFFTTQAHEILGGNIISRLLHAQAPHIGGTDGDIQYELATLSFNQG